MTSVILSIVVILVVLSFVNSSFNKRRQIAFNRIDASYDKMELFVIQNDIKIDNQLEAFLFNHQNFKVNNGYADIHVLLTILQNTPQEDFEKRKIEYEKVLASLPNEFKSLVKEFDKELEFAILLSVFRVEFLAFFFYLLFRSLFKSTIALSNKSVVALWRTICDLLKYESVVVSHSLKVA